MIKDTMHWFEEERILEGKIFMGLFSQVKNKVVNFNFQELFSSILWAVVVALIFRTFLFEPFRIPSTSMVPTLMVGDFLFTSKYSYGFSKYSFPLPLPFLEGRFLFSEPERGDVIVFKGVHDPETFYIKRLIGLPGDSIQIRKSVIYINDKPVERKYVGKYEVNNDRHGNQIYSKYIETLPNNIEHDIIELDSWDHAAFPDSTIRYIVPEKHYFFMGDNRNNSKDSRYLSEFGYIPEDRLVGKARYIFMSADFSFIDFLPRLETGRAFKAIYP